MKANPVLWIRQKRAPSELPKQDFELWDNKVGYHEWETQARNLSAADAYVLWEKTVMPRARNIRVTQTEIQEEWTADTTKSQETDISAETAKPDRTILKRALDLYLLKPKDTRFTNPRWWIQYTEGDFI